MAPEQYDALESVGQDGGTTTPDWDFQPEPSPTPEQLRAYSTAVDYTYPDWL